MMSVYRCMLNEMHVLNVFSAHQRKIYQELHLKKSSNCYEHNSWKPFHLTFLTSFTALASGGWLVGSFVGSMGSCLTVFTLTGRYRHPRFRNCTLSSYCSLFQDLLETSYCFCCMLSSLFSCWSGSHQLVTASCSFPRCKKCLEK